MDDYALDFVIEKTHELMEAPSCCAEAKEAAQAFLDSIGTDRFDEEAQRFYAEIEEDIAPIDHLIELTTTDMAKKYFGEEQAAAMHEHAMEVKANGGKYCDCAACAACEAILSKKEEILGC